jgi:acyl-CoA thioester hydrolase
VRTPEYEIPNGMTNETTVRVRYAETDQMGVVYHANYFVWFEVGRVELLRQLGFSYRDMEENDRCFIAVVEARCRFKSPARYDDEVCIRTSLKHVRDSFIKFGYEAARGSDGELLAEGETMHIVTDAQMNKRILPKKYQEAFRAAAKSTE